MKRKLLFLTVISAVLLSFLAFSASAEGENPPVSVPIPEADSTVFTYNGEEQEYGIPESEYYEVVDGKKTDAGEYTVSVNLKDTENYVWSDGSITVKEYSFVIRKAVLEPDDITFEDKTVVCDGMFHSIYAQYPKGIEAEYTGNGQVDPGVYSVKVKFSSDNYEPIPDRTAILTVNRAVLRENNDTPDNSGILLWSTEGNGFNPSYKISVISSDVDNLGFANGEDYFFVKSYKLTVLDGDTSTALEETMRIQLPIPEYLLELPFKLVAKNGDDTVELDYALFNKHVVYETDSLSEVAFVYEEKPLTAYIITFSVLIVLLFIAFIVLNYLTRKRSVLMSFSPIFFGAAVSSDALTVLIILVIISVLLLALDVMALLRFLKPIISSRKRKTSTKEADLPSSDTPEPQDSVEKNEEKDI